VLYFGYINNFADMVRVAWNLYLVEIHDFSEISGLPRARRRDWGSEIGKFSIFREIENPLCIAA